MSERSLSECDICTQLIGPTLRQAGGDLQRQVPEKVRLTQGRGIESDGIRHAHLVL